MSFATLPPELQEDIIADLKKPDLASLCLVSKSLLHLARPLLYRSVDFDLDSWQRVQLDVALEMQMTILPEEDPVGVMDETKAGFDEREYRQNKLLETLEAHQDWEDFVQEVNLDLDVSVEGHPLAPQLGRLLSSCQTLQTLSIRTAYHDATDSFLLEHIPPSLLSLNLDRSKLPAAFVLRLLDKLSLLETLSLGEDAGNGLFPLSPDHPVPRLDRLRFLTLALGFRGRSFFSVITSSSNSLSTLVVDFMGVQTLVPERLSFITNLSIRGEVETSNGSWAGYSENLASDLVQIFKGCQSLRYLNIRAINLYSQAEPIEHSETLKILHHLPTTLQTLVLESLDFSSDYLFDYLSSPQVHLRRFDCSRLIREEYRRDAFGPTSYDEESEDRIEEICEAVNIHLNWIGGRVRGQRDEGMMIRALEDITSVSTLI